MSLLLRVSKGRIIYSKTENIVEEECIPKRIKGTVRFSPKPQRRKYARK
jgi:hypothetical protein